MGTESKRPLRTPIEFLLYLFISIMRSRISTLGLARSRKMELDWAPTLRLIFLLRRAALMRLMILYSRAFLREFCRPLCPTVFLSNVELTPWLGIDSAGFDWAAKDTVEFCRESCSITVRWSSLEEVVIHWQMCQDAGPMRLVWLLRRISVLSCQSSFSIEGISIAICFILETLKLPSKSRLLIYGLMTSSTIRTMLFIMIIHTEKK